MCPERVVLISRKSLRLWLVIPLDCPQKPNLPSLLGSDFIVLSKLTTLRVKKSNFFPINTCRIPNRLYTAHLAWGDTQDKASPSGGLTLKKKIKTDVWALVGMVVK